MGSLQVLSPTITLRLLHMFVLKMRGSNRLVSKYLLDCLFPLFFFKHRIFALAHDDLCTTDYRQYNHSCIINANYSL